MTAKGEKKPDEKSAKRNTEDQAGKIILKSLPTTWTPDDCKKALSCYGKILEVILPVDKEKKRRKFGFVRYESAESAGKTIDAINKGNADNITAEFARPTTTRKDSVQTQKEKKRKNLMRALVKYAADELLSSPKQKKKK